MYSGKPSQQPRNLLAQKTTANLILQWFSEPEGYVAAARAFPNTSPSCLCSGTTSSDITPTLGSFDTQADQLAIFQHYAGGLQTAVLGKSRPTKKGGRLE